MNELQTPPCCIEAEEAVLGALLLNPTLISRVVDMLPKEAFFVSAHGIIYEGMCRLHTLSMQADLIALSTHLHERKLLEQIGGTGKLAMLLNRTVSATAIDGHIRLVVDKYKRRQLIAIAYGILEISEDESNTLSEAYDRIRELLPEEIVERSTEEESIKITEIKYTVRSDDRLQEVELKADVIDDENMLNEVAKLAAKAIFYSDRLWGKQSL